MNLRAQSTIEFTFAMVVVALLIYGLVKTFRWVGMDYAQTSYSQRQENFFVHPAGCDPSGLDCFSEMAEESPRPQRLKAVTRSF